MSTHVRHTFIFLSAPLAASEGRLSVERCFERKLLGVFDRLSRQINVQIRPIEVMFERLLDSQNGVHGSAFEPWKLFEREKDLTVDEKNPEPVTRDVRHFSFQDIVDGASWRPHDIGARFVNLTVPA